MAPVSVRVASAVSGEEVCRLDGESCCSVGEVKAHVARAAGVPEGEQRLLLGGRELRDAWPLEDVLPENLPSTVELSLVRGPRGKRRHFSTMDGWASSRWAFHHEATGHWDVPTNLNNVLGIMRDRSLFVRLQQGVTHVATFSLCSFDFPLRELFDTFAEQTGTPISELCFLFQGRRLRREDTPHLCGMEACEPDAAHVIEVTRADGWRRRQRVLGILNKMGAAVQLKPVPVLAEAHPVSTVSADTVLRALSFLPLEDLVSTTPASTFWFHATQRLSLLLQLRHGDVAFAAAPPEEYTAWLTGVFGHSQWLAAAEARGQGDEAWPSAGMSKERARKPGYGFTKAAGCRRMPTVHLEGLPAEFERQWLSLHSSKVKFMADCKLVACGPEAGREHGPGAPLPPDARAPPRLRPKPCYDKDKGRWVIPGVQEAGPAAEPDAGPPPGCGGPAAEPDAGPPPGRGGPFLSAEAERPELRAAAVELFRRYFSPDMYFVFPLMVGREAALGLDFRSTHTTLFFSPGPAEADAHAVAGACSWRLHWPAPVESEVGATLSLEGPLPLLEVLFIAVWEEERDQVHGGSLVQEVEEGARRAGAKMLYVEIGYEQPKARRFWKKQGFGRAVCKQASAADREIVAHAEESEDVLMPLVPLEDVQFAFFESNCLRFSDTAQYVKLL